MTHPPFNHLVVCPQLSGDAQLLMLPGGQLYARVGERTNQISGSSPDVLRELVALCNAKRTVAEIADQLQSSMDREAVVSLLVSLLQAGILEDARASTDVGCELGAGGHHHVHDRAIALFGNSQLFAALHEAFAAAGIESRQAIYINRFSTCESLAFRERKAQWVLSQSEPVPIVMNDRYERIEQAGPDEIRDRLTNVDFAVCALECVPYEALFEINRAALSAGTPCLFVTVSNHQAILGPTVISGTSSCFHCRLLANDPLAANAPELFPLLNVPGTQLNQSVFLTQVAAAVVDETIESLGRSPSLARVNSLLILEPGKLSKQVSLLAVGNCPDCGVLHAAPETRIGQSAQVHAAEEIAQAWQTTPIARSAVAPDGYRRVGILGGGTAGYLSALALRRAHPELEITLIESSRIPVIGVGEATTPELVRLLHAPRFLGLDVADFYQQVMPTFKLGIKFQWGGPAPYDFPFPFQRGRLPESLLYEGSLNDQSLGAMLMARHRVPVFRSPRDGTTHSLLHRIRWAYHLDNRRFVSYLQQQANLAGIKHVDAEVAHVDLSDDNLSVTALRTVDGQVLDADLWIDCSGFRSLLMEKQMQSAYIDYSPSLFTDRAVVANAPNGGLSNPYTHAQTMNAGWCWTIPFLDADHHGYVYSSSFLDEDRAVEEMKSMNPDLGDHRVIHFRSGRHTDFWKGNVVALGNAYGFVEPLQSTALHMLVFQIELLTTHFPASKKEHRFKEALNNKVGERWDSLRWFLGVHYRYNRARNTEFWRAANSTADISGAEQRVALYRERAPMSYKPSHHYRLLPPEFFSDDHAFDSMLMGLKVPTDRLETVHDRATWQRLRASLALTADTALEQREALRWLQEEGQQALHGLTEHTDSWVLQWYPA